MLITTNNTFPLKMFNDATNLICAKIMLRFNFPQSALATITWKTGKTYYIIYEY